MDIGTGCELIIAGLLGPLATRGATERHSAGPLSVLHFDYQWHAERRRFDEFIIHGVAPAQALEAITAYGPTPYHVVTVVDGPPEVEAAYMRAGYALVSRERLMARSLAQLPPPDEQHDVRLAQTPEEMAWLNEHDPNGVAWITPETLGEPALRHYAVVRDGEPVARARAFAIDATHSYVSHVHTAEAYRRQGIARALMLRLLHDAAATGATWSVLLASEQGALLYEAIGYSSLAPVLVFKPVDPRTDYA